MRGKRKILIYGLLGVVMLAGLVAVQGQLLIREVSGELASSAGRTPFPVGVDPAKKLIKEDPEFSKNTGTEISGNAKSWVASAYAALSRFSWYQNLASLTSRILVIRPGERKEEIAQNFGRVLGWDRARRQEFIAAVSNFEPHIEEGKFAPHTYVVKRGAEPADVAAMVLSRFNKDVLTRYPESVQKIIPLGDTLTIASLLEREGRDFDDMRLISGIIWNRLFTGMKLQLDASLQYAKGSKLSQPWWPRVIPADKNIVSPYNTYQIAGLPPAPIANPSTEAILAALNPKKTECMYYFHDKKGISHCSKTYKEHVSLIREYY